MFFFPVFGSSAAKDGGWQYGEMPPITYLDPAPKFPRQRSSQMAAIEFNLKPNVPHLSPLVYVHHFSNVSHCFINGTKLHES